MIRKFNEEASSSPSQIIPGDRPRDAYIASSTLDARNPEIMMESISKGISDSVKASMSASSSRAKARDIKHSVKYASKTLGTIVEDVAGEDAIDSRAKARLDALPSATAAGGVGAKTGGGSKPAGGRSGLSGSVAVGDRSF